MAKECDYLIIGAGLSGATIARALCDAGFHVIVLERRPVVSGNVHDYLHESGIRVHSYGPHLFRTSSENIWHFVQRFSEFYSYEHRICIETGKGYLPWPPSEEYLGATFGADWRASLKSDFTSFETSALSSLPEAYYRTAVRPYTEHQWGTLAKDLLPDLAQRFRVNPGDDSRLSLKRFQGLPKNGYYPLVSNMLAGIEVICNCDFLEHRQAFLPRLGTVYTGPLDALFGYSLGRLKYRKQRRILRYFPDVERYQLSAQVNFTFGLGSKEALRAIEWKHLMPILLHPSTQGTVVTEEFPEFSDALGEEEYPYPDQQNQKLAHCYRQLAAALPNFTLCGRLAEYRYLDMDEAIARGISHAEKLLRAQTKAQSSEAA